MTKLLYTLSIVVITALTFTSCKKEYNCQCTQSASYNGLPIIELGTTNNTIKDTKKKAKKRCDDMESVNDFSYLGIPAALQTQCKLQ